MLRRLLTRLRRLFRRRRIPLPGAAGDSEGVTALRAQMETLKRAHDNRYGEPDTAAPTIEDRRREWLASNEAARSPNIYTHLGDLHRQALESGLVDMSPGYLQFMDRQVAALAAQTPTAGAEHLVHEMNRHAAQTAARREQPRPEPDRAAIVSAPVSREPPSYYSGHRSAGQIRLTPAQREAAKIAGITEAEYAEQLVKFLELQERGEYPSR